MKKLFMIVVTMLLVLFTEVACGANENTPYGVQGKGTALVRKGYVVSIIKGTGVAEWACYELRSSYLVPNAERTDDFRSDPEAEKLGDISELDDYKHSGYDRGHLVPAEDMERSMDTMEESFLLSNMSPQVPAFNRGIWKSLEGHVRDWAKQKGAVNVCTGPIYTGSIKTIGKDKVRVPDAFFKIVMDDKQNVVGFIIPNQGSDQDVFDYSVSVRTVEQKTGINFYVNLSKNIQDMIETKINMKAWSN